MQTVTQRAVALCCAGLLAVAPTAGAQTATTPDPPPRQIVRALGTPTTTAHTGPPPEVMQTEDLVVGSGATLHSGDTAVLQYTLADWRTGRVLERVQGGPEAVQALIDIRQVIPGWWQGMQGMRVGGRRALMLPRGYAVGGIGESYLLGQGAAAAYTVDLLDVTPAQPPPLEPLSNVTYNIWGMEYDPISNPYG